jgi:cob(I)alamin adenosyltransferase
MSKLYTKTGDKGETSLYNGQRVLKNSIYCDSVGNVDELSSALGLIHNEIEGKVNSDMRYYGRKDFEGLMDTNEIYIIYERIQWIQSRLLDLGSHIATPIGKSSNSKLTRASFDANTVTQLELWIDYYDEKLPKLKNFILPKGSAHLARSICRRAERSLVELYKVDEISSEAFIFINRLSDFLFALGRYISINIMREEEIIYKK